jgi:biopolymer transport protein ExbB
MRRALFVIPAALLALVLAGSVSPLFAQAPGATATPPAPAPAAATPGTAPAGTPAAVTDTTAPDTTAAAPATETPEPAPEQKTIMQKFLSSGFVDFYNKGGKFMWWLLALSIMGVALIIERAITLNRAKADMGTLMEKVVGFVKQGKFDEALDTCAKTRGPIPQILHAGLLQRSRGAAAVEKAIESAGVVEMSFLERGLLILATVANLAPLVGFLGTVSGMIAAFEAIAQAEQVSAKLVAAGISEALITTEVGLVIAIPVQLAHNLFVQQIDRFVIEMEDSAAELIDSLGTTEA